MINPKLVRMGDRFKVNATNAKGYYEVTGPVIEQQGNLLVEVKGEHDSYSRVVRLEQLMSRETPLGIVSKSVKKVGEIKGAEVWVEDVIHMPFQERRGRKKA